MILLPKTYSKTILTCGTLREALERVHKDALVFQGPLGDPLPSVALEYAGYVRDEETGRLVRVGYDGDDVMAGVHLVYDYDANVPAWVPYRGETWTSFHDGAKQRFRRLRTYS